MSRPLATATRPQLALQSYLDGLLQDAASELADSLEADDFSADSISLDEFEAAVLEEQVRDARESAGLTQTEAATLIHSTMRAWQEWEAGNRRMHPGLWELFRSKVSQG